MDEFHYQNNLLAAMNEKLVSENKMYRLVCETSSNAFIYFNFAEKMILQFGNWNHFFEFPIEDTRDISKFLDMVEEEFIAQLQEQIYLEKKKEYKGTMQCRLNTKNIWVEIETTVIYADNGAPSEKIFRIRDITKNKNQNDELSYLAYYDSLTGLFNRNYFVIQLNEMLKKARKEHSLVSVLFMDIDDFHKINDGLGIIVGDELVQSFGQFLNEFKSDQLIISHFGSDIFCMAIYDPFGGRSVETITNQIRERTRHAFITLTGVELFITVSIGISEYPEAAETTLDLINCAEIVMLKAKRSGKNGIQYFDAPIINEFLKNVTIERKLDNALKENQIFLNYQPIFETTTKKLRGVEALIRWRDEEKHLISPAMFIPIAEKNGTIIPLGKWVIAESIREFARWYREFEYPMILSINISSIQFKQAEFSSELLDVLEQYKLPYSLIELEITESIVIDDLEDVVNKMNILRGYGIRFSLDDFGTGFSSLSYLQLLPIDSLKIDKSFINSISSDSSTQFIAESIILLSKKLGLETIAEGVEEKQQFELLKKMECDNIQGYYLGRPISKEDVVKLIKEEL